MSNPCRPIRTIPIMRRLPVLILVTLVACSDVLPPPEPPAVLPDTVIVVPGTAPIVIGDTVRLVASVLDSNGATLAGAPVVWTTTNPAAATVDSAGLVRGIGTGSAYVRATSGGAIGAATVSVQQPIGGTADTVVVAPFAGPIVIGDTTRFTATVLDANGDTIAAALVTWTTTHPAIASIDANGLARGLSAGLTTVRAVSGGAQGTMQLRVWYLENLHLVPNRLRLGTGGTVTLTARTSVVSRISPELLSWSSSQPSIASVLNGAVTALGPGTATVAVSSDTLTGQATISVVSQPGTLTFGSVSSGLRHTCGIAPDGAWCWGLNGIGMLGDSSNINAAVPVRVAGGQTFTVVDAGTGTTCGLSTTGAPWCWGQRVDYTQYDSVPVGVTGGHVFRTIEVGSVEAGFLACGLTVGGDVYCWGDNDVGQLGVPHTGPEVCNGRPCSRVPVRVPLAQPASAIAVGKYHACALATGGAAYCWGYDGWGQIGAGNDSALAPCGTAWCSGGPVRVAGGHSFTSLSAYGDTNCAVTQAGSAYCWGRIGARWVDQSGHRWNLPTAIAGGRIFASVTMGGEHACGLESGGAAYCWFANTEGQFGNGSRTNSAVPVPVSGGISFRSLSAGWYHTCGVTTAGIAWCWGLGEFGALGNNNIANSKVPVMVAWQP